MNDEIDRGVSWLPLLFVVVGGVDGDAEGLAIEVGTHVRRSRVMGLIMGDGHGISSIVGVREPTVTACDEPCDIRRSTISKRGRGGHWRRGGCTSHDNQLREKAYWDGEMCVFLECGSGC